MALSAVNSIVCSSFSLRLSTNAECGLLPSVTGPGMLVRGKRSRTFKIGDCEYSSRCRNSSGTVVLASSASEDSDAKGKSTKTEEKVPTWAQPGTDELPPWARSEQPQSQEPAQDLPFVVYLIGSSVLSIAAVGSVFEFFNRKPVFGVLQPESPLWAPVLGTFVIGGLPLAGFLFWKGVQVANKVSEEIDRQDGVSRR